VNDVQLYLFKKTRRKLLRVPLRRLHAYEYLAVMKRDDICGSTNRKKIPVNLADPGVGYEEDVYLRRENDLLILRPHPSHCSFCERLARA
jgi:hypothetical protein